MAECLHCADPCTTWSGVLTWMPSVFVDKRQLGNDDSFKMHLPETKSIKELMNRVVVVQLVNGPPIGIHWNPLAFLACSRAANGRDI